MEYLRNWYSDLGYYISEYRLRSALIAAGLITVLGLIIYLLLPSSSTPPPPQASPACHAAQTALVDFIHVTPPATAAVSSATATTYSKLLTAMNKQCPAQISVHFSATQVAPWLAQIHASQTTVPAN